MDIQKEKHNYLAILVAEDAITQEQCSNLSLYNGGNYFHSDFLASSKVDCINWGWSAWKEAKTQAVPEGFVVVAKELPEKIAEKMAIDRIDKPIHANDPVWSEIAEESYKNQVKLKKWKFWRDYKAMIEAQEPTND